MKKYFLFLFALLILSCSKEDDNVEIMVSEPEGFYKLDIKTDIFDKYNLQGIKAGIINYVKFSSTWCKDVNIGEDFEIWIDNIGREEIEIDRWRIKLDLIIKKSTTFGADEVLNERMEIYYDIPDNLDDIVLSSEKSKAFINESLKLSNQLSKVNPKFTVVSSSLVFINNMLTIFSDEKLDNVRKAEALVTGNIIGERIKLYFVEYEKNLIY